MTISALLMVVGLITLQQGINHKDKMTRWFWVGLTLILMWKALSVAQ